MKKIKNITKYIKHFFLEEDIAVVGVISFICVFILGFLSMGLGELIKWFVCSF